LLTDILEQAAGFVFTLNIHSPCSCIENFRLSGLLAYCLFQAHYPQGGGAAN